MKAGGRLVSSIVTALCLLLVVVVTISRSLLVTKQYLTSYNYILGDLHRCATKPPDIVIWVQGRMTSPNLRSMIRETFGNQKMWPRNTTVTLIFFTGKAAGDNGTHQRRLEYEFEMYNDIVQSHFTEDYRSQVSKMISAINYIADHCNNSKLILKIDDDIIFHPRLMIRKLIDIMTKTTHGEIHNLKSLLSTIKPRTMGCKMIRNQIIVRDANFPDAIDLNGLPGEEIYPPFCAGFFVVMSGDTPNSLQPCISENRPFWIDDKYLGVLQRCSSTTNINIDKTLDFGYSDITRSNLELLIQSKTLVRHLPAMLELHMTQLFTYLRQSGHIAFEPIKYS